MLDENTCRLDFTREEGVRFGMMLELLERPRAAARERAAPILNPNLLFTRDLTHTEHGNRNAD